MLDAMLDSFYSAMENEGVKAVNIIISASSWPHDGNGNFTTLKLAETYNRNFVKRVNGGGGTPKRSDVPIEGFIFAIIDENMKQSGVEQHWGIFNPSMQPNYNIF